MPASTHPDRDTLTNGGGEFTRAASAVKGVQCLASTRIPSSHSSSSSSGTGSGNGTANPLPLCLFLYKVNGNDGLTHLAITAGKRYSQSRSLNILVDSMIQQGEKEWSSLNGTDLNHHTTNSDTTSNTSSTTTTSTSTTEDMKTATQAGLPSSTSTSTSDFKGKGKRPLSQKDINILKMRMTDTLPDHLSNEEDSNPPLVRIHSSCFTSETLGSLRCDCASQLSHSLSLISLNGGIVIYLFQEGRGIGLLEKMYAYNLQDKGGFDTLHANLVLGHKGDGRTYEVARLILLDLLPVREVVGIKLMTNNPDKVTQIEGIVGDLGEGGGRIKVLERIPVLPPDWQADVHEEVTSLLSSMGHPHQNGHIVEEGGRYKDRNAYLRQKGELMGHLLGVPPLHGDGGKKGGPNSAL